MMSQQPTEIVEITNTSLHEAFQSQRPIPPWRQLKAIKTEKQVTEQKSVQPQSTNHRKWLKPFLYAVMLIHTLSVLLFNLIEALCDWINEITIAFKNYVNASTNITGPPTGRADT